MTNIKKFLLIIVIAFGLGFLNSKAQNLDDIASGSKILVLNYHQVDNKNTSLSINISDFDAQMKFLADSGCVTITPDELYAGLNGDIDLPPKPVRLCR